MMMIGSLWCVRHQYPPISSKYTYWFLNGSKNLFLNSVSESKDEDDDDWKFVVC